MGRFNVKEVELPRFEITPERREILLAEFHAVVQNTLELRSAFAAGGRQLDTSAWKLVKTVDDVRAYRSRRALHGAPEPTDSRADTSRSSSSNSSSHRSAADKMTGIMSSTVSGSEHQYRKQKKMTRPPAVVISGIIDGTAEDAALGFLADTEINAKMRESYLGTELEDARLLTVLVRPTIEHPFSFIGLKWGLQSYGRFSQARDFVYLEGTGLTTDSKGLIVAYAVRQSVDVSDILTLPRPQNTIRGHMSGCQTFGNTISTGTTRHRVAEMFSRAFIEIDGDLSVNVAAAAYAEKLMALAITMECANGHKLAYLMKQSNRQVRPGTGSIIGRITTSNHCSNCARNLRKFSTYVLQRGGTCQVCRRTFCNKCSLHKKICVSLGSEILKKSMLFCLSCLLDAKAIPARDVAADKVYQ
ncbi:FYVE-FINGER-CONTAINING RAB5 EFFECTOR PROTEIN RABENOSYN-5-RELATED [Plasmopara halstedii]|uniref:FYVE-FINGER-CONTAINING RAB5 EFFECTOR PROTEIN RABENOSYN-5-RELATED n=1 Tax=Plasmopara halstedii TaxID=4781 RepID=A0A0P1ASC2_PLAHL|nr:FYVE-FINGER-CONTAINING RAB5 EFFECTOR PROTEIN RABENOSYN-5-RELATED [Plasmopara halstedii]CEG44110.1 FYVE-FINGER-CONTAINING RAB5 EFFECTOR PROTEIN RABENOSYN-5-RELATED [Plasmopara halstedii]|eukprot:XP_024580479.1 FYVE-FINGER-CONTAINING RAB5 EFFECTOR PROTEIN RABENOSYN-5-RELATED [Plasmopara halstedii]